jgi:hypothetical protein
MFNLTPDQTVLAGVGIAGAMLATFHPAVEAKIKSFLSSAWARLSGANKPVPSVTPSGGELVSPNDVHILVTQLVAYFSKKNDPEGVKCAARIGTHVYEQQVSDSLTVQGAT